MATSKCSASWMEFRPRMFAAISEENLNQSKHRITLRLFSPSRISCLMGYSDSHSLGISGRPTSTSSLRSRPSRIECYQSTFLVAGTQTKGTSTTFLFPNIWFRWECRKNAAKSLKANTTWEADSSLRPSALNWASACQSTQATVCMQEFDVRTVLKTSELWIVQCFHCHNFEKYV